MSFFSLLRGELRKQPGVALLALIAFCSTTYVACGDDDDRKTGFGPQTVKDGGGDQGTGGGTGTGGSAGESSG
jgi:hypothetical protein